MDLFFTVSEGNVFIFVLWYLGFCHLIYFPCNNNLFVFNFHFQYNYLFIVMSSPEEIESKFEAHKISVPLLETCGKLFKTIPAGKPTLCWECLQFTSH